MRRRFLAGALGGRCFPRPLALFALLVLLTGAAMVLVWCEGRNVPRWDEWENVPYVVGEKPITWAWLWSFHAQHRFVLPRLLYIGVLHATNDDFRSLMYLNVALLAIAAGSLLLAARSARGSWRWSDAVFPLVLLHWGHADNMLWGFQVGFVLSILLFCLLTAAVLKCTRPVASTRVLAVIVPLLLLPLTGGCGFAMALGFAPWLLVIAFIGLRSPKERSAGTVALVGAIAMGALLATYANGSAAQRPAAILPKAGVVAAASDTLSFLAGGLGPAAAAWHPLSTVATGMLLLATVLLLARRALADKAHGPDQIGLAFLLLGVSLLAAVVAWGRSPSIHGGAFLPRYVTLAAPLWCLFHLAWSANGANRTARLVSAGVALLIVLLVPQNFARGLGLSMNKSQRLHSFEMDAWSGLSADELARRHVGSVFVSERRLADFIRLLQREHLGPFSLSPEQRWKALKLEYARFLVANQTQPWIPVLLEEDENRARFAVLSPAPGRLLLRVPAGRWMVSGVHGLRRDAWEVGRSDGVVFVIQVRVSRQPPITRQVYRRWLRPVEEPGDRGPRSFAFTIETEDAADVIFFTQPGPELDASFDSSYWGDLAIVPAE